MKRTITICLFVLINCFTFKIIAQPLRRLNSFSYNINDGLLQSSIEDMNFDGFGFMWLSFETGIQRFDGNSFKNIQVQPGLPDNQYVKFFKSKNGLLWICHSKGVSVYDAATDHFRMVFYHASRTANPAVWPVNEDEGIVYFYESDGYIIGINEFTLQLVRKNHFPFTADRVELPQEFNSVGVPIDHEVLIIFKNKIVVKWNLEKGIVTRSIPIPQRIQIVGEEFHVLNNQQIMFFADQQLNVLDINKQSFTAFPKNAANRPGVDGVAFEASDQRQILMSVSNELFQFDTKTMQPSVRFVNFQNQPFAHFSIRYIRFDPYGNIYLVTRNEGFVKLLANTYPISYYGSNEKQFNFVACIEVDKKNDRVLAGTLNGGFLVFDTLQQLRQHIEQIGSFQKPGPLTVAGIVHVFKNDYLLFPRFNKSCVLWNAITGSLKLVPFRISSIDSSDKAGEINYDIQYYCSRLKLPGNRELLAIDQDFFEIDRSGNLPVVKAFFFTYRTKGLCRFGNYIISGTEEKLLYRDTLNYSVIKKIPIPGCGEIRCMASYDSTLYVGTNHGLYELNDKDKIIALLNKKNGLPDDYIYSLAIDSAGNTWCSTNKGILKIDKNNNVLHLEKEDGLQENEFNTNVVAKEDNEELFFGGVNGINSFYPKQISSDSDLPKVFLTGIRINDEPVKDSAIWVMKNLSLSYNQNNIYFEFTALGKKTPDQYLYQYKMSDVDKNWIRSTGSRSARYLLQPGQYVMQVYADNSYNDHPPNPWSILIVISPPFWQTWWFRLLVAVFIAAIIVITVQQYFSRRYQKKLRALQLQNEIQQERERISRDLHDNIGGQLSFISSSIDWVIDKNKDMEEEEELQQLKAINTSAKKVMGNLRETIWALNKDKINIREFSDKLKVYIQNMLQLQPGLHLKTEEQINNNFVLTPAEMLNIFRICQECVNNVLKHANASQLKLVIQSDENSFHIRIEDNGKGFDTTNVSDEHYGLRNMKYRAEEVHAKLLLKAGEGKGTTVEIHKYSK